MFVYFVRWSAVDDDGLYSSGMMEVGAQEPISTMEDIRDLQDLACKEISKGRQVECERDDILIDFYSLLREEE